MTLFLESFVGSILQCEDFVFSDTNLSYIFIFATNLFLIFLQFYIILLTILKYCLRLQLWGHIMFATSAPGSQNVCDSSLGVHKMFATPAPGSQNVCDSSTAVTKCLRLQLRGQKLMAGSSSSCGTSQVLKVWDNG